MTNFKGPVFVNGRNFLNFKAQLNAQTFLHVLGTVKRSKSGTPMEFFQAQAQLFLQSIVSVHSYRRSRFCQVKQLNVRNFNWAFS